MSTGFRSMDHMVLTLGIATALGLLFIMGVQPFHAEEIFVNQDTLTGIERIMLLGFGLIVLFNVLSLGWLLTQPGDTSGQRATDLLTAALGVVCMVLLFADKVMADEVAHEWGLEGGSSGEWYMMYIFLSVQLIYILIVIWKSARKYRARDYPPTPPRVASE